MEEILPYYGNVSGTIGKKNPVSVLKNQVPAYLAGSMITITCCVTSVLLMSNMEINLGINEETAAAVSSVTMAAVEE